MSIMQVEVLIHCQTKGDSIQIHQQIESNFKEKGAIQSIHVYGFNGQGLLLCFITEGTKEESQEVVEQFLSSSLHEVSRCDIRLITPYRIVISN